MSDPSTVTPPNASGIQWRWRHFDLHTAAEWHAILQLRAAIFVVEQDCPYLDPDQKDPLCWHLSGYSGNKLVATLRAVPPDVSYVESSIGRVVVDPQLRGMQLGRALMLRGIAFNKTLWNGPIRISGQGYLQDFYQSLGFATERGPYMEDDIPHFEMLLP